MFQADAYIMEYYEAIYQNILLVPTDYLIENLENKTILDVDINPIVVKENRLKTKVLYECELDMRFLVSDSNLEVETKNAKIPFEYVIDNLENGEEVNMEI